MLKRTSIHISWNKYIEIKLRDLEENEKVLKQKFEENIKKGDSMTLSEKFCFLFLLSHPLSKV